MGDALDGIAFFFAKKIPIPIKEWGFSIKRIRRRPTLPPSHPGSTIGAEELNFRDPNGNGCDLLAIATEKLFSVQLLALSFQLEDFS